MSVSTAPRTASADCIEFIPLSCGAARTKREKGSWADGEPGGATAPIQDLLEVEHTVM